MIEKSNTVQMEFFFNIILIFIFIPSYIYAVNLTYVLSPANTSEINSFLRSNAASILTNGTYVKRLLTTSTNLLSSTQTLIAATDVQSVVFTWNSGDCSYPSAIAITNPTKYISSSICFTSTSSLNNLLQLTVTTQQLGQAATIFMNQNSLHYFSMILSDSNVFDSNLAIEFSSYLVQKAFIFERLMPVSSFTSVSSINSLKSRGKSFSARNQGFLLIYHIDIIKSERNPLNVKITI